MGFESQKNGSLLWCRAEHNVVVSSGVRAAGAVCVDDFEHLGRAARGLFGAGGGTWGGGTAAAWPQQHVRDLPRHTEE